MMMGMYLEHLISALQEEEKYMYLIKSTHRQGPWFFFDVANAERPYKIMWVKYMLPAFKFPSEKLVEEFRTEFLAPRKVEIIRLERNQ